MSRHFPPFLVRDYRLFDYAFNKTKIFVSVFSSEEEAYNYYMDFLMNDTDGKNFRIASFSNDILNAIKERIASYRSKLFYSISFLYKQSFFTTFSIDIYLELYD